MIVWLNGVLEKQGSISYTDRGFTLGDGAFATMCYTKGAVEHFDAHMYRMRHTLSVLQLPIKYSNQDILHAICDVVGKNNLYDAPALAIRLTISRGVGGRGLLYPDMPVPSVLITAGSIDRNRPPAKLTVAQGFTRNDTDILCNHKISNYASAIVAFNQAVAEGFDDCILLNTKSVVCCTSIANIFGIRDGVVYTPDLKDGCLNGIFRNTVIKITQKLQIPLVFFSGTILDYNQMDMIFITNSITGIRPVYSLNQVQYDMQNPVYKRIKEYKDNV